MNTNITKDNEGNELPELMQRLSSVDEKSPEAIKNETSISDNNGGRIKLYEGKGDKKRILGVDH